MEERCYYMGDDVRMQNEVVAHMPDCEFSDPRPVDDFDRLTASIDSTLRLYDSKVDSLCDRYSLSERYRTYVRDAALWTQGMMLGQARFDAPDHCLPANAREYAREKFSAHIGGPITLHPETRFFLSDYIDEVISVEDVKISFNLMDHLAEVAANEQDRDILARWQTATDQDQTGLEADINRILNSSKAQNVFNAYWQMDRMHVMAHRLDSIGAAPIVKARHLCNLVYRRIEHSCQYMPPMLIDTLRKYADFPVGIEKIERMNDYYLALENRAFDTQVLRASDSLQGISEGEALLKKILEPFRGKIVLLDMQGTWCGPCKDALSHSTEEYARLNKYDVAYVYPAKASPADTWENVIKEYNVTGDNVAHYNLPDEQQEAIEQYLGVHSFPTYKLFDRNGNMLDVNVDARDLDRLETLIMRLSPK